MRVLMLLTLVWTLLISAVPGVAQSNPCPVQQPRQTSCCEPACCKPRCCDPGCVLGLAAAVVIAGGITAAIITEIGDGRVCPPAMVPEQVHFHIHGI